MRPLLSTAMLLFIGCATTQAPATEQTTVAVAAPAAEAQPEPRVPNDGREATAEEYKREVMERAAKRGVKVMWVHGPRGDGYIIDRRPPSGLGFQPR